MHNCCEEIYKFLLNRLFLYLVCTHTHIYIHTTIKDNHSLPSANDVMPTQEFCCRTPSFSSARNIVSSFVHFTPFSRISFALWYALFLNSARIRMLSIIPLQPYVNMSNTPNGLSKSPNKYRERHNIAAIRAIMTKNVTGIKYI